MGYILLIIIILVLWGLYWLRRHPDILMRWMARRIQKNFTRQAGEQAGQRRSRQQQQRGYSSDTRRRRGYRQKEPIIPPEYAQDVEFTESRIYSSDTEVRISDTGSADTSMESQVSDVEWEEVKIRHNRK